MREDSIRLGLEESWAQRRLPTTSRTRTARRPRRVLFEELLELVQAEGPDGPRGDISEMIRGLIDARIDQRLLLPGERSRLEDALLAEVEGFGPLEPLRRDPTVSDILVNGAFEVWVDRFGVLEKTDVRFDDEAHVRRLLDRLVAAHGRHLDEASPHVDFRLADGTRVNALIAPLTSRGAIVSIRLLRKVPFRMEQLIANGSLTDEIAAFLRAAVNGGLNIALSGGVASGKTTMLDVLARGIPTRERIVTIEETAELRLDHPHVIPLEARLPNIEGRGEVPVRVLVKNALRMRADRLIVGEVRGGEVFDMLQAMNTGHNGSLTTVHANSPEDALRRLENLVLMGGVELPSRAIRELLGSALDLVVQLARYPDGRRRVTSVSEVVLEGSELRTVTLYRFRRLPGEEGQVTGVFEALGEKSVMRERLVEAGFIAGESA